MAIDQTNWRKHLKNIHWLRFKWWFGDVRHAFRRIYRRVRYQWFTPYQLFTIRGIKATDYRDIDTLLVEAVFQMLVNFVEVEKAHMAWLTMVRHYQDYMKGKLQYEDLNRYFDLNFVTIQYATMSSLERWLNRAKLNEDLGLLYLSWEESLRNDVADPPEVKPSLDSQADAATEIKAIYNYIKHERPNRPDPWMNAFPEPELHYENEDGSKTNDELYPPERDESGEIFFRMRKMTIEYAEYLTKCSELEQKYYEEDTAMAQRILKIRQSLWT